MLIESYVGAYLTDKGYSVTAEVPKVTKPGEFVTIERTGGGQTDYIDRATLAVQAWADSMVNAAQLATDVSEDLRGMIEEDEISKVTITGPYNFTDPTRQKYRYQATVDVVYYITGDDYAPDP